MSYFFLLLIFKIILNKHFNSWYSCSKKESQSENTCSVLASEDCEKCFIITDNCKSDSRCKGNVCQHHPTFRRTGQSCNVHQDCLTSVCHDGKCIALTKDSDCTTHLQCSSGLYCHPVNHTCQPLCHEGEKDCTCGYGLLRHGDKHVCLKFGILNENDKTEDARLCKSGIMVGGFCREVQAVGGCVNNITNATVTFVDGTTGNATCKGLKNSYGNIIYYADGVHPVRTILWKNYLKLYNKLNLDKFYTESTNYYDDLIPSFGDNKIRKAYVMYEYAEYLLALEIINKEGKVEKDCEFNFLYKHYLVSSYIGLRMIFLIFLCILNL